MADIKEVITALELCNRTDSCGGSKCPYHDKKLVIPCFMKVRLDALELLKEQQAEINFLKAMQLKTVHNMSEQELGEIVKDVLGK